MRKIIVFGLAVMTSGAAIAAGANMAVGGPGKMFKNLTEEQKACLEAADCPKPEMKKEGKGDIKKGEKPGMAEEAKFQENRECMKKAAEKCGIEMPEKPERTRDQARSARKAVGRE